MTYQPGQVSDPVVMAELHRIGQVLTELGEFIFTEVFNEPDKPRNGMLKYADGASWDPGSGAGMYLYNGASWNFLQGAGGSGETNTISNVGGEKEVAKAKVGVNFPLRTLKEGSNITITQNTDDIVIAAAAGGGTEFLDITEFDDTDATYYFYGGIDADSDWKINRYLKTTFVRSSADEANNPSKTTLAAAWPDRLTLTYV